VQEKIDGLVAAVALYSDPTAVSSDMTITGWSVTLTIRNIGPTVRHRGEYAILAGMVAQLQELPEHGVYPNFLLLASTKLYFSSTAAHVTRSCIAQFCLLKAKAMHIDSAQCRRLNLFSLTTLLYCQVSSLPQELSRSDGPLSCGNAKSNFWQS
jgi:hypothetical protein